MQESNRSLLSLTRVGSAAGAVALLAEGLAARAQEVSFTIAPYIWFTGISADLTIGSNSTSASASFIDLVENSETLIGFAGYGAVHWGNWSFYLDGLWSRVTADASVGPIPVEVRTTTSVLDFGLAYRFPISQPSAQTGQWGFAIEPYVGGRYSKLSSSSFGGYARPPGSAIRRSGSRQAARARCRCRPISCCTGRSWD